MKVSEYYELGQTQGTLDFIDVAIDGDTNAYIEPRAIRRLEDDWAKGCVGLLQNFFDHLLDAVRDDNRKRGFHLLYGLREPNETHLGMSTERPRGTGLGPGLIEKVWKRLSESEAAKTGLLNDLEETALVVREIDVDRISDVTTNIIRQPLIDYTQEMAEHYGIPTEQLAAGRIWDASTGMWSQETYAALPKTPVGPLLLVPKVIVRRRLDFNADEYFDHYILKALGEQELSAGSGLVQVLKDGRQKVYKKDVRKKYADPDSSLKEKNEKYTLSDPRILEQYRADKAKQEHRDPPLTFEEFEHLTGSPLPDWDALLSAVTNLKPGQNDAKAFHRAVEKFLTAFFYPSLTEPRIESELHQGRKRVDIRYTNTGIGGFFGWAHKTYPPQPYAWVECKNYNADLNNDALDQLSGRFSDKRGNFGFLVCRQFKKKTDFIARCRDTAKDDRGFVIVLDDEDLTQLVAARKEDEIDDGARVFAFLTDRFAEIL